MSSGAPNVPEGTTAADRVRAFLDTWRSMPSQNPELIYGLMAKDEEEVLLVRDLRILLTLADSIAIMAPQVPLINEAYYYSKEYTP